ncbi:MAG: DMT family transporter [Schleiferiaceae bacterium]|nr:DMT family transporter [Schleiferiaceae bacterium]
MANSVIAAHVALFAVALIYGINYSVAKEVMPDYLQPQAFIFLRVVGASFLFWIVTAFRKFERIAIKDFPLLALCGLFGVALNQMLFFEGLNLTTPINAAIIMVTTPMLVILIAVLMKNEQLTGAKIIGVLIGAAGAIYLVLADNPAASFSKASAWGDLLVFFNATSFALYLVLVRPLMTRYKPLTVINWVFFFGTLLAIPFGIKDVTQADFQAFPIAVWWKITFVVVAVTFLTYLFNTFALKYVSASVVSSYIYLQPVLAATIAVAVGSDTLTVSKIFAAVLIFVGVYLVSFFRK